MKKHILTALAALAAALSLAISCAAPADGLRTGDLIFVGIPPEVPAPPQSYAHRGQTGNAGTEHPEQPAHSGPEGDSMAEAIADATGEGELNLIHVAILDIDETGIYIIDATTRRGVDRHPLDTFIVDFTRRDGSLPEFLVKRLRDPLDVEEYVARARAQVGKGYNLSFVPCDTAYYCSELVHDCYVTADGPLFDEAPMNFLDSDGNLPPYWSRLFTRLGVDVPQGIPGTNPQAMSTSSILVPVNCQIPISR